jgi:hypothetical protein
LFVFGQQPVHGGLKEKVQDSTNHKLREPAAKSARRFNILVQWRRCHFDNSSLAVTMPAWRGLNYTHLALYEPYFVFAKTTNGNFGFGRVLKSIARAGGGPRRQRPKIRWLVSDPAPMPGVFCDAFGPVSTGFPWVLLPGLADWNAAGHPPISVSRNRKR